MKKGRRLLAMLLVFVMLSGVIGPDTLMKLAAYADDGIVETTDESSGGDEAAVQPEETQNTEPPAEPPAPGTDEPAAGSSGSEGGENAGAEATGAETPAGTEESGEAADGAEEAKKEISPEEEKKPAAPEATPEPYDHKIEKIKLIPGVEMSLSGVLPAEADVCFRDTKYKFEHDELTLLYKAELHVYDGAGVEFKPAGKITVELKGDPIRKSIEQGNTFGLFVNEKEKEAEFVKAKEDTVSFRIREFDLFVLYEARNTADEGGETPEQTAPAVPTATEKEKDDAQRVPTSADTAETGMVAAAPDEKPNAGSEEESGKLTDEGAEDLIEEKEEEPAEKEKDEEDPAEEKEEEEEKLSYRFRSEEDLLVLPAFLTERGLAGAGKAEAEREAPEIEEAIVRDGDESAVELQELEEGLAVLPKAHFESLTLTVRLRGDESVDILLLFPEGPSENSLSPEIPGEATMTLTGFIPEGSTAEATPLEVAIDGNDALAAYNIDIYAPDTDDGETWQPAEGETVTVDMYDPSFEGVLYVYHMADENAEPELVACVEAKDGGISFEAASFSVYVVVPAPEPVPPGSGNSVQSLEELAQYYSRDFSLSINKDGVETYFLNTVKSGKNGGTVYGTTTEASAASAWSFEAAGSNTYYISTVVGGVTKYMFNTGGNEMDLHETNKTAFEFSETGTTGRFFLKAANTSKYLQYSGGGEGFRLYNGHSNAANSSIALNYLDDPAVGDDPYELDGKTYGLTLYRGDTSAYAMTTQPLNVGGIDRLASRSLLVRRDPMDQHTFSMWPGTATLRCGPSNTYRRISIASARTASICASRTATLR